MRRWLWTNSVPLFDDDPGTPIGVVTTIADITARRQDEQLRLALTVFQQRGGDHRHRCPERILSVNSRLYRVTGCSAEEAMGNTRGCSGPGTTTARSMNPCGMTSKPGLHGGERSTIGARTAPCTPRPCPSARRDKLERVTHYVAVFSGHHRAQGVGGLHRPIWPGMTPDGASQPHTAPGSTQSGPRNAVPSPRQPDRRDVPDLDRLGHQRLPRPMTGDRLLQGCAAPVRMHSKRTPSAARGTSSDRAHRCGRTGRRRPCEKSIRRPFAARPSISMVSY